MDDEKNKNNNSAKQCYRSQTCVNSMLSKSLSQLTLTRYGQNQRYQDLEDVYFYDCLNVFNISIAIVFFLSIILYKGLYNGNTIPDKLLPNKLQ